jgi:hypothetical protein
MFNKLVSSSTTSYLTERRTTSIELVELVDLVEKVQLLTSFFQMMLNSLEKFKTITTLRLKKCHKISRTLILAENSEQLLGEPIYTMTIAPRVKNSLIED